MLPNKLIRGGHGAHNLAVLAVIRSHGTCWASLDTISSEVGCTKKSVSKAIKYWVNKSVLKKDKRAGSTSIMWISMVEFDPTPRPKTTLPPGSNSTHKEEQYKKNKEEDVSVSHLHVTTQDKPVSLSCRTWDMDTYLQSENREELEKLYL